MTRGYQSEKIKEKLIDILRTSKTGLSGTEISKKLGINRITITKYLNVFAAEGLIKQKNIGSVNLWFIDEGVSHFNFPADFFQVQTQYLEYLLSGEHKEAYGLLRNSLHSNANPVKILTEVISPAIDSVKDLYEKGKIGKSEKNFLDEIISNSIQIVNLTEVDTNPNKNSIVFSTEHDSSLLAQTASAALHADGWKVSQLGDMSLAMDVMFDIDLQKFLNKIWIKKQGLMIIVIFSSTESGSKFFSEAVITSKKKFGKGLYLVLCTKQAKKTKAKADFVSENLGAVLQWCQTTYESSQS
ncbi:MAG TPA: B12-binding domain-containing protein [Nitrosopumilaceae archaeon]|nr:B12-binding domain-containing protein [Nitrosopumilaceae archaeon]